LDDLQRHAEVYARDDSRGEHVLDFNLRFIVSFDDLRFEVFDAKRCLERGADRIEIRLVGGCLNNERERSDMTVVRQC
jgi:hypothetical protein